MKFYSIEPNLKVALVEPEIPQNTGSIARTCAATHSGLHLIGKLGFDISEKAVRRAGLDYWKYVSLNLHNSWDEFTLSANPQNIWLFSTKGQREYWDAEFSIGDTLVFGKETKGLGDLFLSKFDKKQILRIPILSENVRSLNLSNAVSIVIYEAIKQLNHRAIDNS